MHFDFNPAHPTIWVFLSLVLVIGFAIYKGAHTSMAKALDARAEKIRKELEDARKLRDEAQALLASYKRKQAEAEEQAKEIVAQARKEAELMADNARKDLAERIRRRSEQAEAKIKMAEAQAVNDVKAKAADLATKAAHRLLQTELSATDHAKLVKEGTEEMGKILN